MKNSILALGSSLVLVACSPDAPHPRTEAVAPPDEAPSREVVAAETAATKKPEAEPAKAPARTDITFTPAPGWVAQEVVGAMRRAHYVLPRAEGDTADGELIVYFNGKMGMGPVEANLNRWASQFEVEGGGAAREKLTSSARATDAGNVTEAAIEGTYVAEKTPGSGERYREAGWKLMGAILETELGPYYVKLVGPKATVDSHASAFREFVSSAK